MRTFAQEKSADSRARQGSREQAAPGFSQPAFGLNGATETVFRKSSCPCGGGCSACQAQSGALKVSQPGDATEVEADQLADRVMRAPTGEPLPLSPQGHEPGKLHAKCDECEEEGEGETILRKEASVAAVDPPPDDGAPHIKSVTNAGGSALDPASRSFFEPRFGIDLGHVRVHTDSMANAAARSINARAYTQGTSIVFGGGEHRPHENAGKELLAHELAHVALHGGGSRGMQPPVAHRKAASQDFSQVPSVPASVESAIREPGQSLAQPLRTRAENFFGQDLGHVRVHDGPRAATAAAANGAHAISAGPHVLLSRHRSDLSRSESQRTLAHEIAHSLQPQTGASPAEPFDAEGSSAERAAHAAADAFMAGDARFDAAVPLPSRRGLSKERDPRLETLIVVIDGMPLVLNEESIARDLRRVVPDLDILDPDNFEPLKLLLDEHFGRGTGDGVLSAWNRLFSPSARRSTARTRRPVPAPLLVVAPGSMTATAIETEIEVLRSSMDMPPLVVDAPMESPFEPRNEEERRRYERLTALEAEFYDRRRLSEFLGGGVSALAEQQRGEPRIGMMDVVDMATSLGTGSGAPLPLDIAGAVLGHPVDDLTTGFVAGFLGGAVLELPRDVFIRLDAETREHPIAFNGGVILGAPVGAVEGLRDMVVGLYDLLEFLSHYTPDALIARGLEDAYRMIWDREALVAERTAQYEQAMAIGEAMVTLVTNMYNDPAFMLEHGWELGDIAGRASARWFNDDFMERSTFDKGFAIGRVEGRIIFEIAALFLGPEEWIGRGAAAVGELARLSAPLRAAILAFIERIPALRRLLVAGRDASVVAREVVVAERAVTEGGEILSEAGRASEAVGDLSRSSGPTEEGARVIEGTVDEAGDLSRAADDSVAPRESDPAPRESEPAAPETRGLDPGDLREFGETNPETVQLFREHPDRLHAWAENAEARRVCKLCNSPCVPPNATHRQTQKLNELLERARREGRAFDDHQLHELLNPKHELEIQAFIRELEASLNRGPGDPMVDLADREMLLGAREAEGEARFTPDEIETLPERFAGDRFSADMSEEELVELAQQLFPEYSYDPASRGRVVLHRGRILEGRRRPAGSTVPDLYMRGARRRPPISLEAKNYFVGEEGLFEQFIVDTVTQARQRVGALPRTAEQHLLIDLRGQDVTRDFAHGLRRELSGRSEGILRPDRIHFLPAWLN